MGRKKEIKLDFMIWNSEVEKWEQDKGYIEFCRKMKAIDDEIEQRYEQERKAMQRENNNQQ